MYRYNYAEHDDAQRLVAVGDSFVCGCIKDPIDYQGRRGFQQAEPFTQILAKRLKLNYAERGLRGGGNWDIYNAILEMAIKKTDLVLVAWSGIHRSQAYYQDTPHRSTMWIEAILNTTAYLDNIGCKYYYLSSFQDYRLTTPEPVPEHCTRNWLWDHDSYSTLYDLCVVKRHQRDLRVGEFHHGCLPDADTNRLLSEYLLLSERYTQSSPYLAGCHHPSQQGHELLADIIHDKIYG